VSFPIGLGLGVAALRRIKKTGAEGRGFAIAGTVIGAIGTALLIGGIALALFLVVVPGSSSGDVVVQLDPVASALAPIAPGGSVAFDV
jgi:hypothetical protein